MKTKRQLDAEGFTRIANHVKYRHQHRRVQTKVEVDDKRTNGELLEAASILLDMAKTRAKQRNLLEAAAAYEQARKGIYSPNIYDYAEVGYSTNIRSSEPPPNWPLTKEEWDAYDQRGLLVGITELVMSEQQRTLRHQQRIQNGVSELDDEVHELFDSARRINDSKRQKQWRREIKALDAAFPVVTQYAGVQPMPMSNASGTGTATTTASP